MYTYLHSLYTYSESQTDYVYMVLFLLHTNSESDSRGSQTVVGLYTPIILTEVACNGTEQGLTECNYQEIGPDHYQCSLNPQEATVSCAGMRASYYG